MQKSAVIPFLALAFLPETAWDYELGGVVVLVDGRILGSLVVLVPLTSFILTCIGLVCAAVTHALSFRVLIRPGRQLL